MEFRGSGFGVFLPCNRVLRYWYASKPSSVIYKTAAGYIVRWRPYRCEYTGSLQNSEVNRSRARIVLRWGTAREVLRVLPALLPFAGFLHLSHLRGVVPDFAWFLKVP